MKRVMVVGASVGQIPLIKKAKELGYYVAVADYNPKAPGISLADKFYNASTIDEQAILQSAMDFRPDGIVTMQTDMPMRAIARVNEELNLCGIDIATAMRSTDKVEMIRCFKDHSVGSPWFYVIENHQNSLDQIISNLSFPCILKPADNSASRGVCLVKDRDKVKSALEYSRSHSHSGVVLAEEYMQGAEVSVEILIWNRMVHVITITDKITTGAPYFVEIGHREPSMLPEKDLRNIRKLAIKAVEAVGIHNGEAHVEIILTEAGPKVVELGARLGGDFITSDLVPLSTGVDMLRETLHIACGEEPNITKKYDKGSSIRFIQADTGIITEISGVEEAEKVSGIERIEFFKKVGDSSVLIQNSLDRIGCVIACGETAKEAEQACEEALEKIKVETQGV